MQLIKKGTFTLGAMSMLWLVSCSDEPSKFLPPVDNIGKACEVMDNGWTIPTQTVVDGGVGKDGIPSIDNPQFGSIGEAKNMLDDELVIVVKMGDIIRVYPQRILDQHEIVND